MQLLVLVLNKDELLDELLKEFVDSGIKGATIIDSMGMARALTSNNIGDVPIFGSLKLILNEGRPYNKTIFVALKDEQVDTCIECVKKVVGGLDKPDAGILFTLPINHIEGFSKQ
jgi:nitrogen regulatory protein P-II 1